MSFVAFGMILFVLIKSALGATQIAAISLIAGGTLSNVIDRLLHDGRVLDFINIVIAPLHLMIFNLADAAIAAGGVILAISTIRRLVSVL